MPRLNKPYTITEAAKSLGITRAAVHRVFSMFVERIGLGSDQKMSGSY
jgi:hypothetical protein